MNVILEAY